MVRDMTSGNPTKLLLSFAVPMLIGNIFQQLYNMVDAVVVGQFVGVDALGAVGATGSITFFVIGFIIGLMNGFAIIISQRFGASDEAGLRRAVTMSILLAGVVTVVMTVLSVSFARPLLTLMNTPGDIYEDAYEYLLIMFAGTFTIVFYNLAASILRALGDSRTPLIFLVIASVLNVVLDLLFVLQFNQGVAGVAYATVISQAVSAMLGFIYMFWKFPLLRIRRSDWRIEKPMIRELLRLGLPAGFQNSVTAIGVMALQTAVNGLGSTAVAAYTAAFKVEQLLTQPIATFGMAMATFSGQNLGAWKIDRIRQGLRKCMLLTMASAVLGTVLMLLLGEPITLLFVSAKETEVIALAKEYMNVVALFLCVLGTLFVYRSALQGMGNARVPFLSGVMELIMRTAAALILVGPLGFFGVTIASPIAWVGGAAPLVVAYYRNLKKLERQKESYESVSSLQNAEPEPVSVD